MARTEANKDLLVLKGKIRIFIDPKTGKCELSWFDGGNYQKDAGMVRYNNNLFFVEPPACHNCRHHGNCIEYVPAKWTDGEDYNHVTQVKNGVWKKRCNAFNVRLFMLDFAKCKTQKEALELIDPDYCDEEDCCNCPVKDECSK